MATELADGADCVDLSVSAVDGRAAAAALDGAHAWIPDDASWAAGAEPDLLAPVGEEPIVVATTPIYLVADPPTRDRLSQASGDGSVTWAGLAAGVSGPEPLRLLASDPASSGAGLVGVAAVSESTWVSAGMDAASGVLAAAQPLTRTVGASDAPAPQAGEVGVSTEHALLAAGPDPDRAVVAPADATAMLRYTWLPTVLGDGDPAVEAARQRLLAALTGDRAQAALAEAGLRGPDMAPIDGADWLPAAQAPPMPVLKPHHVEHVFAAWYPQDRIADLLIVVDISGSMFAKPPGSGLTLIR